MSVLCLLFAFLCSSAGCVQVTMGRVKPWDRRSLGSWITMWGNCRPTMNPHFEQLGKQEINLSYIWTTIHFWDILFVLAVLPTPMWVYCLSSSQSIICSWPHIHNVFVKASQRKVHMQRSLRREAREVGGKLGQCGIKEAEGKHCFKKQATINHSSH